MENISISDFQKIEMRIGKILSVEAHPNAEKLLVLRVSFSELGERQIVAGLKGHYSPEELESKKAVFAFNLSPAMLRGVKSEGMILAAVSEDKKTVVILEPEKDIEAGTKIQ